MSTGNFTEKKIGPYRKVHFPNNTMDQNLFKVPQYVHK